MHEPTEQIFYSQGFKHLVYLRNYLQKQMTVPPDSNLVYKSKQIQSEIVVEPVSDMLLLGQLEQVVALRSPY